MQQVRSRKASRVLLNAERGGQPGTTAIFFTGGSFWTGGRLRSEKAPMLEALSMFMSKTTRFIVISYSPTASCSRPTTMSLPMASFAASGSCLRSICARAMPKIRALFSGSIDDVTKPPGRSSRRPWLSTGICCTM